MVTAYLGMNAKINIMQGIASLLSVTEATTGIAQHIAALCLHQFCQLRELGLCLLVHLY